MADDMVTRLREQSDEMVRLHGSPDAPDEMLFADTFWFVCQDAADEIERLRRMAMTLIDELRQNGGYEAYTPEMLFQEFYDEARRD